MRCMIDLKVRKKVVPRMNEMKMLVRKRNRSRPAKRNMLARLKARKLRDQGSLVHHIRQQRDCHHQNAQKVNDDGEVSPTPRKENDIAAKSS